MPEDKSQELIINMYSRKKLPVWLYHYNKTYEFDNWRANPVQRLTTAVFVFLTNWF